MKEENLTAGQKACCAMAVLLTLLGALLQTVPGMRFSGRLSLILAFGCGVWLLLCQWERTDRRAAVCKRILAGCCAAGALVFGVLEGLIVQQGRENWSALPADAVIVLGAGVNGQTPSLALQTRIDAAQAYLEAHPDIPAVLSGGRGEGEAVSEAEAMHQVLTERGIGGERLIKEERSASTAENLAFSQALLEERGIDTETASIAVVTNDFHIFRMKLLSQRQGLQTIGIPASLPWWWLSVNYHIREAFAVVKSLVLDWPVPAEAA